jgi:hypothetical protein
MHISHETSAAGDVSRALAHELAPAAVMVWAVVAGHGASAATMVAAALALGILSFAYAPLARSRHWAREHLADLWAMLLLMSTLALTPMSRAESTFLTPANVDSAPLTTQVGHGMGTGMGGGMGPGASSAVGVTLSAFAALAVVAAWVVVRVLLARRAWRIHSLVSAIACGAGLLWMLLA